VKFEWDAHKAALNLLSHDVSFEEAASVFGDPFAATVADPDHSTDEQRFITMGVTFTQRLLVVVHTDRGDRTRIISARAATRAEKKKYEEGQDPSRWRRDAAGIRFQRCRSGEVLRTLPAGFQYRSPWAGRVRGIPYICGRQRGPSLNRDLGAQEYPRSPATSESAEAAEQADAADEVREGKAARPSQLIRSVSPTLGTWARLMSGVPRLHQQAQIEDLLRDRGWRVVERSVLTTSHWLDEVWTIESEWSPVGQRAFVSFIVDRQVATRPRQRGQFVSSVAVSRKEPVEASFGCEILMQRARSARASAFRQWRRFLTRWGSTAHTEAG
jgi:uncharacterized protein